MEGLGIDPKLLLAQIVNFLVLLFVLQRFLYRPILKFLDERKRKIEESLVNSEKIKVQLAKIEEEKARIIQAAEQEGTRIIAEEKKVGEGEKERIVEEAKLKAAEELKKGTIAAKLELEKARVQLHKEAISLGRIMARKILQGLSIEEKHKLVDEAAS